MSTFSGYKTKAFSESQKFFVLDPNTGTPSFVQGSDLVKQLTPNSNYVYSESTRTTAQATDYAIGSLVQTAGAEDPGDNLASVYLVVASGEGDFPMQNGNELLVVAGDDTLREQLAASPSTGQGATLVNGATVYVGSVAELEALSLAVGVNVYLTEDGRAGEFVVKSGAAPSDPQKGIYIILANGNYAMRRYDGVTGSGGVQVDWFYDAGEVDHTAAIVAAKEKGLNTVFSGEKTYRITSSIPVSSVSSGTMFVGNGAKINADYEQSGSPSYSESAFYLDGADSVTFKDFVIEYLGTYTVDSDYGGLISGIHVERSDNFVADNIEAFGFNRAGINIGMDVDYCLYPKVVKCKLHDNRVSGAIFGNTDGGELSGCVLERNGISTSVGTGYGFSGWSACIPKNTIVKNNQANNNWRKGIDFHAGDCGIIEGNVCSGNRIYGIYVMGVNVKGSWGICNNIVRDMQWADEFPTQSVYGIRIGSIDGQGLTEKPTNFDVIGNTIESLTKTAGDLFAFGESLVGMSFGTLSFTSNIISVGDISQVVNSSNDLESSNGNYFDVFYANNKITVDSCSSTSAPIYTRSSKNRVKQIIGNIIEIGSTANTGGVIVYDTTSITNKAFVCNNNTFIVPSSTWSAIYDPAFIRRTPDEKFAGNVVNGQAWRSWDGYKYIDTGAGAPASNYWNRGSVRWEISPVAGGTPGYMCVTSGEPGTWKAMASLAA